jgi:hypothetical protein
MVRSRLSRTGTSGMPTIRESRAEPKRMQVDFDIDQMGIDAVHGGAADFERRYEEMPAQ